MGSLLYGLFFIASLALAARRPRLAALAMVFWVPWNGLDTDFGLRVFPYQLAVMALLLVTAARSLQPGWRPGRPAAARLLAVFIVLAVVWSLIQLAFIPEVRIAQTALQAPLARAAIQIVLFVFSLSPALLLPWWLHGEGDVRAVVRTYLWSVGILAALGWFQLIVWYGTGVNPLPIGAVSTWLGGHATAREAQFGFELLDLRRMNSLAGEPRQLGGACVFAMLLIQAVLLTAERPRWQRLGAFWLFLLATTALTYSTSAVLLWGVCTAVQLVAPRLLGVRFRRSGRQLITAVAAVVLPVGLMVAAAEAAGIPVVALVAERTIDRLDENGAVEDFDLAILDWLHARPDYAVLGSGLGNAHLYAGPYLAPEFRWYAEDVVFTAKPGYLRIVSELGIVGLLMFLAWFGVLLVDATRVVRGTALAAAVPAATMALAMFMANGAVVGEFWAVAGTLAVIARIRAPAAETTPARRAAVALSRDRSRRLAQKLGQVGLAP